MSHNEFESFYEYEVKSPSNRLVGFMFGAFFTLIFIYFNLIYEVKYWWAMFLSSAFLSAAVFRPSLLISVNRMWMGFASMLHKISNPLLLGVLFFLVFTPVGLIRKLFVTDIIRLRRNNKIKSYWVTRDDSLAAASTMHEQF